MSVARRAKAVVTRPLGHRFPFCGTPAVAQGVPRVFLSPRVNNEVFPRCLWSLPPPRSRASWLSHWSIRLPMGTGSPIVQSPWGPCEPYGATSRLPGYEEAFRRSPRGPLGDSSKGGRRSCFIQILQLQKGQALQLVNGGQNVCYQEGTGTPL